VSPSPCDCPGCPNVFSDREAEKDLRDYRRQGPSATTRALLDAIVERGVDGATVLDIGGGIGAIQLELLGAGAAGAVAVDASSDYVATARAEAERRGYADRTAYLIGDFVALAADVEPADVVTLDKVVCCYSNMTALVSRASERARRMIGFVYPRDTWYLRAVAAVLNALAPLVRARTRFFIHRTAAVDDLVRAAGFEPIPIRQGWIWNVVLYERSAA
jgi:magnesium-protoporphyrin O-methyltransferase